MICIIVDIDGTIANNTHRQNTLDTDPKDWDAFFSECHLDEPITSVVDMWRRNGLICLQNQPKII